MSNGKARAIKLTLACTVPGTVNSAPELEFVQQIRGNFNVKAFETPVLSEFQTGED
jgi:hypothetical protein